MPLGAMYFVSIPKAERHELNASRLNIIRLDAFRFKISKFTY